MRPSPSFFAAIGDYSNATIQWRLLIALTLPWCVRSKSVLESYAIDVVALEIFARGFGLVAVQAGEAGAVEHAVALVHGFGKRIGVGEQAGGFAFRGDQTLPCLLLRGKGADLNNPPAAGLRLGQFGCGAGAWFGSGDCGAWKQAP